MEYRQRDEQHKKEMVDSLDMQMEIKEKEKQYQKHQDRQVDDANLRYQYNQFDRRKYQPNFKSQNPKVYDQFRSLEMYKKAKEDELHHILVEEGAVKKKIEEDRKLFMKEKEKSYLTNQMKQTLNLQIAEQQFKAKEGKRVNPEELTYGVI